MRRISPVLFGNNFCGAKSVDLDLKVSPGSQFYRDSQTLLPHLL
jgi:hypothetical protein